MTRLLLAAIVFSAVTFADVTLITPRPELSYTFMVVGVKDENGNLQNEKFFLGPLPEPGQAVEMVYVGPEKDTGFMRFQLRVRR